MLFEISECLSESFYLFSGCLYIVAGAAAGAAATPLPMPAGSGERAGELLSSNELSSNTCGQSTQPTRAHQILQSGQKCS